MSLPAAVTGIAAFLVYINTLDSGFVYDDNRAILANDDLLASTPISSLLFHDYWGTPLSHTGSHGSYRPLTVLSFRLNAATSGVDSARHFHLVNVVLHAATTALFTRWVRTLTRNPYTPWVSGGMFAVHPAHTEAVAGIVGRADVGCGFFLVLSLMTYRAALCRRDEGRPGFEGLLLGVTVVLGVCAVLTKELGVATFAVCAVYDVIVHSGLRPRDVWRWVQGNQGATKLPSRSLCWLLTGFCLPVVTRVYLIQGHLPQFSTADNPAAKSGSYLTRTLTFLYLPAFNFWLLVCPSTLSFDWSMDAVPLITSFRDARNLVTVTFYSALLYVVYKNVCELNIPWASECRKGSAEWFRRTSSAVQEKQCRRNPSEEDVKRLKQSNKRQRTFCTGEADDQTCTDLDENSNNYYRIKKLLSKKGIVSFSESIANRNMDTSSVSPHATEVDTCPADTCTHCSCRLFHVSQAGGQHKKNEFPYSDVDISEQMNGLRPGHSPCHAAHSSHHRVGRALYGNMTDKRRDKCCSRGRSLHPDTVASYKLCSKTPGTRRHPDSKVSEDLPSCVRNRDPAVTLLSIALLVLPFLPATNLVFYVGFVVAERLLYVPSLGYCLLVGHCVARLAVWGHGRRGGTRAFMIGGVLLLCVVFAARTVRRNGDWKDEESLYQSGVHVNPAKALGNLGNIQSGQGRVHEAEWSYREALRHRPNMADVHYNLGVLLQGEHRLQEAIESYRVAIQCRPRLAVAYLNLGIVLARVGRTTESLDILRTGSGLDGTGLKDPKTHETARTACRFHRGRVCLDLGDHDTAIVVLLEAVRTRPTHYAPQSLFNILGEAYSRAGRDSEAETWYRASLSTQPNHVPAHLTYGKLVARNSSRLQEAERWYTRAQSLAPLDPAVYRHFGQFLFSRQRYAEAAAKFERVLSLAGQQEYEDVVSAATSCRLAGDLHRAEAHYRLAIELRPQEASSLSNLGALYHLMGRLQEADVYYKRALSLVPQDRVIRDNLRRLNNLRNRLLNNK